MSSSFTLLVDDDGKIVRWEVVVRMVLVVCEDGVGDDQVFVFTADQW